MLKSVTDTLALASKLCSKRASPYLKYKINENYWLFSFKPTVYSQQKFTMTRKDYTNPTLSIAEKIDRTVNELGIKVEDPKFARAFFQGTDYLRLETFVKLLTKLFPVNYFEDVVNVYFFEEELRSLMLKALAKIEIYVKNCITNVLEDLEVNPKKDPFIHEREHFVKDFTEYRRKVINQFHSIARSEVRGEHPKPVVLEYKETYNDFPRLPFTIVFEIISFGKVSHFLKYLEPKEIKKINQQIAVPNVTKGKDGLVSWIHTFSAMRNVCAHNIPLISSHLDIKPLIPKSDNDWHGVDNEKLSAILYGINQFIQVMPLNEYFHGDWQNDIKKVFDKYNNSKLKIDKSIDLYTINGLDLKQRLWLPN